MDALKIQILNAKSLKLLIDLQDLDLIRISGETLPAIKKYIKKNQTG